MEQCEKILENGEQCSNRAVPGTRFCQTHAQRIIFRPVGKPANTVSPPVEPALSKGAARSEWQAMASPAGLAPTFPGLRADARGILVGPQGLIWLPVVADSEPDEQFNRLVRMLSILSQTTPLTDQVKLLRHPEVGDCLVLLSPNEAHFPNLSVFYDTAALAAHLVEGHLYIGDNNFFVQYRDDTAPHGYDVPDFEASGDEKSLLLVACSGSRCLELANFTEISLVDFCRQVTPQPDVVGLVPVQVYTLAPPPLYPILARYFRAHHLRYRLARLQAPEGEFILFEISPRPDAVARQTVPKFIFDYLVRLPQVAVLVEAHQIGNQRILLQWQHRYPLRLAHVADSFGLDDMVLLMADPFPNMRVSPSPQFFDGDQLMEVHTPKRDFLNLEPRSANDTAELKLALRLHPDPGPTPPIAAVILTTQELGWLRQLLYRLPGDAFETYLLCQGQNRAVLLGGDLPVEGIPFGVSLRRISDTGLFIPLRSRFVPDLPWLLLRQVLDIKDNIYTFINTDYRIDLPMSNFAPLSRVLVAIPDRPKVEFELRPMAALPELRWTEPVALPTEAEPAVIPETTPVSPEKDDRTAKRSDMISKPSRPAAQPGLAVPSLVTVPPLEVEPIELKAYLLEQARTYEAAHDYLAAALCYDFLNDVANSARCYRQAIKDQ